MLPCEKLVRDFEPAGVRVTLVKENVMTNETDALLRPAVYAVNTAPRFKFGNSDSFKSAAGIERHLTVGNTAVDSTFTSRDRAIVLFALRLYQALADGFSPTLALARTDPIATGDGALSALTMDEIDAMRERINCMPT